MNRDQKLDAYAQARQDFIQHFPQIVKMLTEDGMGHLEMGDAIAQLKELPQAFFLVPDDIMDSSLTQQGGLDAINDALLLESSYQTEIGQTLDLITSPQGSRFTEKRYKSIVKCKMAFYSLYLPMAAKEHANAKKILLDMGEFFQIQDDFLDLFGDPSVMGKIGTDIQDNKCSWVVVQCLKQASPKEWKENYGQKEAEKVAQVKPSYELIEQCALPLPPAIFLGLVHNIFKRKK
ncbi:unnamed protein product [Nyctereutes procyonoides]|uniref:Farnesyl pyrophosphate synthase n=1 Tax=Nyctereutes procyonoides TaxID=34880 RepID=A0A811YBX0_NYCPR|nr:unnamed protein product [Nyctereutes procyonoides]